ncbi:MAG: hypothetical protein IT195_14030 [Microthrixaceae bacterium]|nr:hypothetical protein [Microthrixaceae bacterium]
MPDIVLLLDEVQSRQPVRARVHFHPAEAACCQAGADSFAFRHGPAVLFGQSLLPQAADQLILGTEDRRTTYLPPGGRLTKRHRYVYIENLCRKPRLLFVSALQFGRRDLERAEFARVITPEAAGMITVSVARGRVRRTVTFDLHRKTVRVN